MTKIYYNTKLSKNNNKVMLWEIQKKERGRNWPLVSFCIPNKTRTKPYN